MEHAYVKTTRLAIIPAQVTETANIPFVVLPVADPFLDLYVKFVVEAFVSLEYVYLLTLLSGYVWTQAVQVLPKANIPIVLFPTAIPPHAFVVELVADVLLSQA